MSAPVAHPPAAIAPGVTTLVKRPGPARGRAWDGVSRRRHEAHEAHEAGACDRLFRRAAEIVNRYRRGSRTPGISAASRGKYQKNA